LNQSKTKYMTITKKVKFIDLYYEWGQSEKMPNDGLCDSLPDKLYKRKSFQSIIPTENEKHENAVNGGRYLFWGITDLKTEYFGDFTELRQNIVLLCACMEEEY